MIGIIQFRTDESIEHERKCYRKYLPNEDLSFTLFNNVNVDFRNPKEVIGSCNRIILGGSGEYLLSSKKDYEEQLKGSIAPLLNYLIDNDFTTLGMCFGAQLLGQNLGSEVIKDPEQAEAGMQQLEITEHGQEDPIFKGVSSNPYVAEGHKDSLKSAPHGSKLLATSRNCRTQAFKFRENIYGTQFHAELSSSDLSSRLTGYEKIEGNGLSFDAPSNDHGPIILSNFANI